MEDNKIIKEQLLTLKKQILENSTNEDATSKLIDEMCETAYKLVNITELDCGKGEEEASGNNFRIVKTSRGILYHEYGGYNIFVTPNHTSLYNAILDIMEIINMNNDNIDKEEKDRLEAVVSASTYCLSVPKIAFLNADYTFDFAMKSIEIIKGLYDKMMSEPLQEETVKEDTLFKNAELAIEDMKNNI